MGDPRSLEDELPELGPDSQHPTLAHRVALLLPGFTLAIVLASVATLLGHLLPIIGAPVFAIVGGIIVSLLRPAPSSFRPGIAFASKSILQGSIVVLGTDLSFHEVVMTGSSSLPVMLGSLAVALLGAVVIGRSMKIDRDLYTLIGVGTGICGASAIAATDAVISAREAEVSYAIATIFTFNVVAVLTFPTLGHVLRMTPHGFGLWAGTAVNDVSSVVAAASIFGHGATSTAVVVKLARTLMIIPITLGLALWRGRRGGTDTHSAPKWRLFNHVRRSFPKFIGWFLLAVTINTVGMIPHGWHTSLSDVAAFMITVALAGIGLSTKLRDIRAAGSRPLVLGAILWVLVAATSLGLQLLTGTVH
ncbi:MAG: YeiH family protein [Acidimicrobiales bacterium]